MQDDRGQNDDGAQYSHGDTSAYAVELIAEEAVAAVCSPSFLEQLATRPTVQELASAPLLHVSYDDDAFTSWAEVFGPLGHEAPEQDPAMAFTSYPLALDMARRGEGIALGWQRSIQQDLDDGTLVRIDELPKSSRARINDYLPKRTPPRSEAFEFLAEVKRAATSPERPNAQSRTISRFT